MTVHLFKWLNIKLWMSILYYDFYWISIQLTVYDIINVNNGNIQWLKQRKKEIIMWLMMTQSLFKRECVYFTQLINDSYQNSFYLFKVIYEWLLTTCVSLSVCYCIIHTTCFVCMPWRSNNNHPPFCTAIT